MFSFLLLNFPIKAKRLDKSQPNLVLSSGFSKNLVFRERDRGREKGRERERETDRQTDRQADRQRQTHRQTKRESENLFLYDHKLMLSFICCKHFLEIHRKDSYEDIHLQF